ncbi:helix-turn-helix transcriptional regulator [Photorhabdus aegyptia]|uniref:Response regulator CheY-like receiver protein n=1 Tax=Photorhabdus aegyptia TaxID=2805098 RepID=A0A022PSX9_9GAMM|nr:PAS domain-containing protein [Photorhabdus aegyptia]EYU17385.1 response regulator CheY-like receiver protein [Photorhabdus aegyptia]
MSKITPQLTNMWDKSHESWFVKDKNLRFIYANKVFIKLSQLPEDFDVMGYSAKELPTPFNCLAHLFEKHDRKVLQSMQRISSIGADLQSNDQRFQPYFCEKYPLMDESNQCIGIICRIKEISHFSVENYIKNAPSISVRLRPPNDILTEKEWMVIFLFCRGISNQGIANEMNISCCTLERYFKSICEKLSIRSIIELKLFCEKNDYDLYIPPKYLKSMNYFLLY